MVVERKLLLEQFKSDFTQKVKKNGKGEAVHGGRKKALIRAI